MWGRGLRTLRSANRGVGPETTEQRRRREQKTVEPEGPQHGKRAYEASREEVDFETSKRRNRTERRRQGAQAAKHTTGSVCCCRERKRKRKIENITDKLFTSRLRKASDRIRRAIGTVAEAIRIPEIGISDAPKVERVAQPGEPRHKPTPIPVA